MTPPAPPHREPAITRTALALALGLCLALSACGSDDDADDTGDVSVVSTPAPSVEASRSAEATATPKSGARSPELESALDDVRVIAPALEGLYRNREYPRALDKVIASLPETGIELAKGNTLGAYKYDEQAVEFTLCVENKSGAYATYDTAPMATGEKGESGGCPQL